MLFASACQQAAPSAHSSLIRTAAEPASANCAVGGVKFEVGLDSNDDGELGDDEVNATMTRVICGGAMGTVGTMGVPGPKGDTGAQGEVGPQGPAGAPGVAGPPGDVGPQGDAGVQGPQGEIGPMGLMGPPGVQGMTGATGPAGPTGATGPQGEVGPAGPTGAAGPQGPVGAAGPQGPSGISTLPSTALQCVDTADTVTNVSAGATANSVAPACPTGYTVTGTNCKSSTWQMPFVFLSNGVCSAQNNSQAAETLRSSRTCCRVPAITP